MTARWTALKDFSNEEGFGDEMGRNGTRTVFENEGRVVQAEENQMKGKSHRFLGFIGRHTIAKVPAEEIEFPVKYPWMELENGLDCFIAVTGPQIVKSVEPLLLKLKLRNRRAIDQQIPETLESGGVVAAGVEIHLYKEEQRDPVRLREIPQKSATRPALPPLTHTLVPMANLDVLAVDIRKLFEITDFQSIRSEG